MSSATDSILAESERLAAAPADPSPDVDLIAACKQHAAAKEAFDARPLDEDEEDSPHWPAYLASVAAISAARPTTLAGLAAKARAVKRELANDHSFAEDVIDGWMLDLVYDIIRMEGAELATTWPPRMMPTTPPSSPNITAMARARGAEVEAFEVARVTLGLG